MPNMAAMRVWRGLGQDSLSGIGQDDRQIGVRGAGRHVAGVLLVSRRVRDDEAAPGRLEAAVGDVDGDALLALVAQTVDQERQVRLVAPGSPAPGILLHLAHLIGKDLPAVAEQPAEKGALAVVHGAAQDEAQGRSHRRRTGCHQK